jgi:carboxypeptidase Taq
MHAYSAAEARFARIADIEGALQVLHWDQAAMMPAGGVEARAEQLATLQLLIHETLSAPETGELLDAASALPGLDAWQTANLRLMRRQRLLATAVPADLVAAHARATARAEMVWRRARAASDFDLLRPHLEEVFRLAFAKAEARGAAQGLAAADALVDQWEPGLRQEGIDRLLAPLAARLPGLLDDALARQAAAAPPLAPSGPFPLEAQKRLAAQLMRMAGFDFERGRLDESTHPFCGGVPDDARITTRYDDGFTSALMAVMHETGHALYSQGLPKPWRRQPVGQCLGMVVHESQSLLLEMQACRGAAFLAWLGPRLGEAFGADPAFAPGNLARLYTRVGRGPIRVDADEITYPLHVVLRHRLERALLAGDLAVADLPGAWNELMRELLGIVPANDRLGCLQDIHWAVGAIGYFPCYTLGAMLAAQLFDAARAALPDLDADLAKGDFAPLVGWLRSTIHSQGSCLDWDELVRQATGRPLEAEPFLAHVERRHLG